MKSQMIFLPSGTSLFPHPNPVKIPYAAHSGHSALHPIIEKTGQGRLDYTVGSALDIFGGDGVRYEDLVNRST